MLECREVVHAVAAARIRSRAKAAILRVSSDRVMRREHQWGMTEAQPALVDRRYRAKAATLITDESHFMHSERRSDASFTSNTATKTMGCVARRYLCVCTAYGSDRR